MAKKDQIEEVPEPDVPIKNWFDCYKGNWKGRITDKSFSHPAKMFPGLIERIVSYGLRKGYWKKGDLLGDCFGGIGTTGLECAKRGLRCFLVELEEGFVKEASKNFNLMPKCYQDNKPIIVQGDSRKFSEIVRGHYPADGGIVTSPPFSDAGKQPTGRGQGVSKDYREGKKKEDTPDSDYGGSEGQIGKLKIDAVVVSPPLPSNPLSEKSKKKGIKPQGRHSGGGGVLNDEKLRKGCGKSFSRGMEYGEREGSIGNLEDKGLDAVITSPPFQDGSSAQAAPESYKGKDGKKGFGHVGSVKNKKNDTKAGYGQEKGNIGNQADETYWSAMEKVYQQCFLALKPGGMMAVHIKDYVANKKRVPLCAKTCLLLEKCGFKLKKIIRAWQSKELKEVGFTGTTISRKERKSFFRRLAEKKGSPRIDWENVIWVRKPQGQDGVVDAILTSPPFADNGVNLGGSKGNAQAVGKDSKPRKDAYGTTKGQIGSLKESKRERE